MYTKEKSKAKNVREGKNNIQKGPKKKIIKEKVIERVEVESH